MNSTVRSSLFLVALVLVGFLSYLLTLHGGAPSSYLQIEVAPASAALQVDGQNRAPGKQTVSGGSHTIKVSKSGFATQEFTVTTTAGQTAYAGAALIPASAATQGWYLSHPSDATLADGIGSHGADYESQLALQSNPFLQQLPVSYGDGKGDIVTIAQGAALHSGGPIAIYVTAPSPLDRQNALLYMRSRGYDPATTDIVFRGQSNPLVTVND